MKIDKDTKLYASFSKKAGNFGCMVHNQSFDYYGLNCIYKSFSVNCIKDALLSMRVLDIKGAGISMPFKSKCIDYLDEISTDASTIGAVNTILNNSGKLVGYNTDYLSAVMKLKNYKHDLVIILGKGGYAKSVAFAANALSKNFEFVTRDSWSKLDQLRNHLIFNCTPVENISLHISNIFIDSLISTSSGKELSLIQANKQFNLYTGLNFPEHIK